MYVRTIDSIQYSNLHLLWKITMFKNVSNVNHLWLVHVHSLLHIYVEFPEGIQVFLWMGERTHHQALLSGSEPNPPTVQLGAPGLCIWCRLAVAQWNAHQIASQTQSIKVLHTHAMSLCLQKVASGQLEVSRGILHSAGIAISMT